jgi:hypothetical protein
MTCYTDAQQTALASIERIESAASGFLKVERIVAPGLPDWSPSNLFLDVPNGGQPTVKYPASAMSVRSSGATGRQPRQRWACSLEVV